MIEPEDMEQAVRRVRDFMDVHPTGGTDEALLLHWQAAGIAPEAVFRLITFVMERQPPEAADAVAQVVSQAAATALIAAEIAGEREAR
jgi:hypothetical protein